MLAANADGSSVREKSDDARKNHCSLRPNCESGNLSGGPAVTENRSRLEGFQESTCIASGTHAAHARRIRIEFCRIRGSRIAAFEVACAPIQQSNPGLVQRRSDLPLAFQRPPGSEYCHADFPPEPGKPAAKTSPGRFTPDIVPEEPREGRNSAV